MVPRVLFPTPTFMHPRSAAEWNKWERWGWEQSELIAGRAEQGAVAQLLPTRSSWEGFQESIFKGQVGWGWVGSRRVFDQLVYSSLTD